MRICLLTSSYPRHEGDIAGRFIRELCRELRSLGHRFEIVLPCDAAAHDPAPEEGIAVHPFSYFFPRRLQMLAYGNGLEENLARRPWLYLLLPPFMASFLIKSIRSARRCDLIWSHWIFPSGLVGSIVSRLLKKPHLITAHSAPHRAAAMLIRPFLGGGARITAVSRALAGQINRALPIDKSEIHCIPMGVSAPGSSPPADKAELRKKYSLGDECIILFMGRLVPIKGVDVLLRAMRKLDRCILVVAGEGSCKKELMRMAHELRVPVRFEGFLHGAGKRDWLALCDAFAAPSRMIGRGRAEGLPVGVLEALSAGAPVVASDTGGMREIVSDGHNGFLVPPGDEETLAQKLRVLQSDGALRERMGRHARASASPYGVALIAERYSAVFDELLGQPFQNGMRGGQR